MEKKRAASRKSLGSFVDTKEERTSNFKQKKNCEDGIPGNALG